MDSYISSPDSPDMRTASSNEFKWTDELVKEFVSCNSDGRFMTVDFFKKAKAISNKMKQEFMQELMNNIEPEKNWQIRAYYCDWAGKKDVVFIRIMQDSYTLFTTEIDGRIYSYTQECLLGEGAKIHSVRRLSDGEVFTIGDKVESVNRFYKGTWKIAEFIAANDMIYVTGDNQAVNLFAIKKYQKQPLLTTEDGKDIYEGDEYWFVSDQYHLLHQITANNYLIERNKYKRFSTEEAAKEYILMNKPCLSVNDVEKICILMYSREDYEQILNLNKLKELAKQKINQ